MKEFNYDETKMPESVSKSLLMRLNFEFPSAHTYKLGKIIMDAVSRFLGYVKNPDKPQAVVFKQPDGSFLVAAIVEYNPNKDDPKNVAAGSWSYTWTFSEKDVEECNCIDAFTEYIIPYFESSAKKLYGIIFENSSLASCVTMFLEVLHKWVFENTTDAEGITLNLPDAFTINALLDGGNTVVSIEPSGSIKELIKGDGTIQE